jgi:hypothetical protein
MILENSRGLENGDRVMDVEISSKRRCLKYAAHMVVKFAKGRARDIGCRDSAGKPD